MTYEIIFRKKTAAKGTATRVLPSPFLIRNQNLGNTRTSKIFPHICGSNKIKGVQSLQMTAEIMCKNMYGVKENCV